MFLIHIHTSMYRPHTVHVLKKSQILQKCGRAFIGFCECNEIVHDLIPHLRIAICDVDQTGTVPYCTLHTKPITDIIILYYRSKFQEKNPIAKVHSAYKS